MRNNLKNGIEEILSKTERVLSFSESSSKDSFYFLFRRGDFEFIPIRISNHTKNPYFSNKTFYIDEGCLLKDLREHLSSSAWHCLMYRDYFTLKSLSELTRRNMKIYIDNSMHIFDKSKMGLLFYQIRYFNRNHKEMNTVSESFQKHLRKLFSTGLVNGFKQRSGDLLIYITKMGQDMMDEFTDAFGERFFDDFEKADLRYIEVPTEMELK